MTTTAAPHPTDRLTNTLEEMRASVAAEGTRKGLAGALQAAIRSFLDALVALLAEFKAGRLGAVEDRHSAGGAATAREPDATAVCAVDAGGAGARESGRPMAVLSADGPGNAGVDRGGCAGDADVKPRASTRRPRIAPPSAFAAGGSIQATGFVSSHRGPRLRGREIRNVPSRMGAHEGLRFKKRVAAVALWHAGIVPI